MLGWTYVVLLAMMIVLKAKNYYLAPIYPMLFASGALAVERSLERRAWSRGRMWPKIVIAAAVVLALRVWGITEKHPRTDDAVVRANVVGIAPRVHGQIIKLNVEDNQAVKEGDVLFEIDPEDYRLVLEKAKADLATLDRQIEVAKAQDADLKFQVKAAEAGVARATAELGQASNTLQRLQPLLPQGFATADGVGDGDSAGERRGAEAVHGDCGNRIGKPRGQRTPASDVPHALVGHVDTAGRNVLYPIEWHSNTLAGSHHRLAQEVIGP